MKPLHGRCLAAMLLAGIALTVSMLLTLRPMQAADIPTVEGLLKKSEFDYVKAADNAFKVIVEYKDESSVLFVDEVSLSEDENKAESKMVRVSTMILDVPDGFKHPPAMLKKVAMLNDPLLVGRLSVSDDGDVYYQSTFWLRTADEVITTNELAYAHFNRLAYKKELKPFLSE